MTDPTDIVFRLEDMANGWLCAGLPDAELPLEAAREIQRLRQELADGAALEAEIDRLHAAIAEHVRGSATRAASSDSAPLAPVWDEARMLENGAKAWAGVDTQALREFGAVQRPNPPPPVAKVETAGERGGCIGWVDGRMPVGTILYATPPVAQAEPLTDERARDIAADWYDDDEPALELVRRTERAHGIGTGLAAPVAQQEQKP